MTNPLREANEDKRTGRLPSLTGAAIATFAEVASGGVKGRTLVTSVLPNKEMPNMSSFKAEVPQPDNNTPSDKELARLPERRKPNKALIFQTTLLILVCALLIGGGVWKPDYVNKCRNAIEETGGIAKTKCKGAWKSVQDFFPKSGSKNASKNVEDVHSNNSEAKNLNTLKMKNESSGSSTGVLPERKNKDDETSKTSFAQLNNSDALVDCSGDVNKSGSNRKKQAQANDGGSTKQSNVNHDAERAEGEELESLAGTPHQEEVSKTTPKANAAKLKLAGGQQQVQQVEAVVDPKNENTSLAGTKEETSEGSEGSNVNDTSRVVEGSGKKDDDTDALVGSGDVNKNGSNLTKQTVVESNQAGGQQQGEQGVQGASEGSGASNVDDTSRDEESEDDDTDALVGSGDDNKSGSKRTMPAQSYDGSSTGQSNLNHDAERAKGVEEDSEGSACVSSGCYFKAGVQQVVQKKPEKALNLRKSGLDSVNRAGIRFKKCSNQSPTKEEEEEYIKFIELTQKMREVVLEGSSHDQNHEKLSLLFSCINEYKVIREYSSCSPMRDDTLFKNFSSLLDKFFKLRFAYVKPVHRPGFFFWTLHTIEEFWKKLEIPSLGHDDPISNKHPTTIRRDVTARTCKYIENFSKDYPDFSKNCDKLKAKYYNGSQNTEGYYRSFFCNTPFKDPLSYWQFKNYFKRSPNKKDQV